MTPSGFSVLPVRGIPEVRPGDRLVDLLLAAAPWLEDNDVLVVTSKIVSKAEGALAPVPLEGPDREAARAEIMAAETARVVAVRGHTRIVQTHHGFVMASAGIDTSRSALVERYSTACRTRSSPVAAVSAFSIASRVVTISASAAVRKHSFLSSKWR